jgi:GTP-binding protein
MTNVSIRNIAIIAHVDHGKTTLVDQLLRQGGAFRDNQQVAERIMDSMDLEREKGITIKAKNTSVHWKDSVINIVDTPGHADFGAEVERVMKMVDGVLLLVDAFEGPQAQTRFVLRKALQHGLQPIVVVNKVDRENGRPQWVHDKVLELFLELEANEEQFNAPFLYASARDGWADNSLNGPRKNMDDLFSTVLSYIRPPVVEEGPFRMLVSNIDWNDYVGRIAIGKVLSGKIVTGDNVFVMHRDGKRERIKITKVFEYAGMKTNDTADAIAGDIIGLAGFNEIDIGETIAASETAEPLPFMEIDPPTIEMEFAVNDGPFAGGDGGRFLVAARGAMQIAVLVEQMRREGYEVLVSRPSVITKTENGVLLEPFENLWVEAPEGDVGSIMKNLASRKGQVQNMQSHNGRVTIEAIVPTRGLIGFEFDLVNLTSGHGVMSHLFLEYRPYAGEIVTRQTGTLVSLEQGTAKAYALDALESRGRMFVGHGDEVYCGMIIGENPRLYDLPVNPTKGKQLTNFRSQGDGKGIQLTPPVKFSLERAIEYIAPDEFVEATPKELRLRKRILDPNERKRSEKGRPDRG